MGKREIAYVDRNEIRMGWISLRAVGLARYRIEIRYGRIQANEFHTGRKFFPEYRLNSNVFSIVSRPPSRSVQGLGFATDNQFALLRRVSPHEPFNGTLFPTDLV